MGKFATFLTSNAVALGGVAAVGLTAAGAYVSGVFHPVLEPSPSIVEIAPGGTDSQELLPNSSSPMSASIILPQASATQSLTIDLVRVETDGSAMIAGQAAAQANVEVLLDGTVLDRFQSDGNGSFAGFMTIPASATAQVLTLRTEENGVRILSDDQVILSPGQVVQLTNDARDSDLLPKTDQSMETAASRSGIMPVASDAQTVLLANQNGVRVLRDHAEAGPEIMSVVALDTISYDAAGEVELSGRGARSGFVRIYLDNSPVTTSRIAADGNWQINLPEIDTGIYTLRVDEIDDNGAVTSRVETPFKRENREVLARQGTADSADVTRVVTVQPGNTLWAIARDHYGEGVLYARVFDANKDRIRNPDLIYPGQLFDLPK